MNTNNTSLALILISISTTFSSCTYDEGPLISLRTKASRLTGSWEVEKISDKEVENNYIYRFEKDNEFKITNELLDTAGNVTSTSTIEGDWDWLNDDKESITLEHDGGEMIYKIIRLTNSELWLEDEDGEDYEMTK